MNPPTADGVSPWRKATTRKPISNFKPSPTKEKTTPEIGRIKSLTVTGANGQTLSPPNSDHKNSTKINDSQQDIAASPNLFRMEETAMMTQGRTTRSSSFTKIKTDKNSSLNNSSRKSSRLLKSGSELFSDDEQPSGSVRYVGENSQCSQSTINNTRNTTNGGVRKRNATINESKATTGNILNVSPPTPPPKSSSCCRYLSGFLAAIVVILSFAIVQETGVDGVAVLLSQLYPGAGGDTYLDSAQHWQAARKQFTHDLAHIKTMFPNQSSTTWKMIGATLKSPLHPLPDYPGVLLLLASPHAVTAAHCLMSKLLLASSSALNTLSSQPHPSQVIFKPEDFQELDPDTAKEQLTQSLHDSLARWRVAGISDLDHLHPTAALTLHAFADNSNAPYKQAVMIFTVTTEEEMMGDTECNLETKVERILYREWEPVLGRDKLSALLSRIVVSVATVREETQPSDSC